MTDSGYLEMINSALGLQYLGDACAYRRIFTSSSGHTLSEQYAVHAPKCKGSVIGIRDKRILSIGLISTKQENSLLVAVTFPPTQDPEPLRTALENLPGVAGGISGRKLIVRSTAVILQWQYAVVRPNPSEVVALIDRITPLISTLTRPFTVCSMCGAGGAEGVLHDEIPGYHCPECQNKVLSEASRKRQEYLRMPVTLWRACTVAGFTGLILAGVGGLVLNFYSAETQGPPPKLAILTAVVIAAVVGHLFERNVGRIIVWQQAAISGCIALVCIFVAELINATLLTMQQFEMKPSPYLVLGAARELVSAKLTLSPGLATMLMQIAACGIPGYFLKRSRPGSNIDYRRLSDVAKSQALAAR